MEPHLLRRLEESSGFFGHSFSNRYMNWKRTHSIEGSFLAELKRRKAERGSFKVLDVGCGDGWLLYHLKSLFGGFFRIKFCGIDLSLLDIDFAEERKRYFSHEDCEFMVMDTRGLCFSEEEFDVIIISEVVEHLERPEEVVKEIYRVLRRGGLVILTTPRGGGGAVARFFRFLSVVCRGRIKKTRARFLDRVIGEKERQRSRLSSSMGNTGAGLEHVAVKTPFEWKKIFREHGFTVQSMRGTGGLLFGDPFLDEHRVFFALTVIADALLDIFPWSFLWSETLFFELRKG